MTLLKLAGTCLLIVTGFGLAATRADDRKLEAIDTLPEGLPEGLQKALSAKGQRVSGPDGPAIEIWFTKSLPVIEGFQPSLNVKYPLTSGQFVGVLRVAPDAELTDFRDQELEEDHLYVLRYAHQPADGNHIGTSETFDFLLLTPAPDDDNAATIENVEKLQELSAAASGTTHPAILSLLPADDAPPKSATLTHDAGRDFWILQTSVGEQHLPLKLVVIGVSAG